VAKYAQASREMMMPHW